MTTHKTLETARTAAKVNSEIRFVLEIDHATDGRCFIGAKGCRRSFSLGYEAAYRAAVMAELEAQRQERHKKRLEKTQ